MPQPDYVPLQASDRVRPTERLPVPDGWKPDRPADVLHSARSQGSRVGRPGPDQGYGLKLAKHFKARPVLTGHEEVEDVIAGCYGVGIKRSALFGRAPTIYDFEWAYRLFLFLDDHVGDFTEFRRNLFETASHNYEIQRQIADLVSEDLLRVPLSELKEKSAEWRGALTQMKR